MPCAPANWSACARAFAAVPYAASWIVQASVSAWTTGAGAGVADATGVSTGAAGVGCWDGGRTDSRAVAKNDQPPTAAPARAIVATAARAPRRRRPGSGSGAIAGVGPGVGI